MSRPINNQIILSATSTGAGQRFNSRGHYIYNFWVVSTGVTTGANIKIQGSNDDGISWIDIAPDFAVSSNGTLESSLANEYYEQIRANVSAYTDGTHDIYLSATGFGGNTN